MVKPIKMVEKAEGKEKIQNLTVKHDNGRFDEEGNFHNYQVTYNDIAGYQVNGDLLGVTKKDGGNIVIPMRLIEQIETFFIDKE